MTRYIVAFYIFPLLLNAQANQYKKLSLETAINLATDSSLEAFKAKNLYLSEYWMYRT